MCKMDSKSMFPVPCTCPNTGARTKKCPVCGGPSTPLRRWRSGKLLPIPTDRCVYAGVLRSPGGQGYYCKTKSESRG
jgi:hypothetical protein